MEQYDEKVVMIMKSSSENNHEMTRGSTGNADALEELASLSNEELQAKAAEIMMGRAAQENPLLGQLNDMFSQWEAMMESYRQEELEEPCQDGATL